MEDLSIVGSAVDVSETVQADAKLQQHIDAHSDTLDRLATAVAIFGRDQKLNFYNRAFAKLWGLPKPGSTPIPTMPKSSTACARRANCRSSATIRSGKRQRLALYAEPAEYLPRNTGTCRAARRCAWWRSRTPSAASPFSMRT